MAAFYINSVYVAYQPSMEIKSLQSRININSGKIAFVKYNGLVFIKDLGTGKISRHSIGHNVSGLEFSPDGTKIAYFSSPRENTDKQTLKILNLVNDQITHFPVSNTYMPYSDEPIILKWSRDGSKLHFLDYYLTDRNSSKAEGVVIDVATRSVSDLTLDAAKKVAGSPNIEGAVVEHGNVYDRLNKKKKIEHLFWRTGQPQNGTFWAESGKAIYSLTKNENGKWAMLLTSFPENKKISEWDLAKLPAHPRLNFREFDLVSISASGSRLLFKGFSDNGDSLFAMDRKSNQIKLLFENVVDVSYTPIPYSGAQIAWVGNDKFFVQMTYYANGIIGPDPIWLESFLYDFESNKRTSLIEEDKDSYYLGAYWNKDNITDYVP